jgi:hypothetical protein
MVIYVKRAQQNRIESLFFEQTIKGISKFDTNDHFSLYRRHIVSDNVPLNAARGGTYT